MRSCDIENKITPCCHSVSMGESVLTKVYGRQTSLYGLLRSQDIADSSAGQWIRAVAYYGSRIIPRDLMRTMLTYVHVSN